MKINNWSLFYILVPLLPFIISGFISIIANVGIRYYYRDLDLNTFLGIFLFSFDSIKLSFASAIMAFFIKVDLRGKQIILENDDKKDEVNDRSATLFIYGSLSFVLMGVLILIKTLVHENNLKMISNLETIFSLISVYLAYVIIRYGLAIKKEFKLKCENLI